MTFQRPVLEMIVTRQDWFQETHATVVPLPLIQTLMFLVWVIENAGSTLSK